MNEHRPFYKLDFRHGTVEEIPPSVPETFREDWEAPGVDAYDLPIGEHPDYRRAEMSPRQFLAVLLVGAVLGWLFAEYIL